MLGGVLDLADLQLADVMVHRKNMEMLDGDAPPEEIVEQRALLRATRAFRSGATIPRTSSACCT